MIKGKTRAFCRFSRRALEGLNPDNPGDFRKAALFLQKTFVGQDGEEREKRKAAPQEATRERSGREDIEEVTAGAVVNAPLDFELQGLAYDHPYLRERGFTEETIKTFGLGYCHRGLMKGRIAIPLHDTDGTLIGYAGRIVDEEAIGEDTTWWRSWELRALKRKPISCGISSPSMARYGSFPMATQQASGWRKKHS